MFAPHSTNMRFTCHSLLWCQSRIWSYWPLKGIVKTTSDLSKLSIVLIIRRSALDYHETFVLGQDDSIHHVFFVRCTVQLIQITGTHQRGPTDRYGEYRCHQRWGNKSHYQASGQLQRRAANVGQPKVKRVSKRLGRRPKCMPGAVALRTKKLQY